MKQRGSALAKLTTTLLRRNRGRLFLLLLAALAIGLWRDSGRTLRAAAPPATTLVSPDSATLTIGKPYFVWDEEATATEYRLKVDDGVGTVIDEWFDTGDVCSGSLCGVTAPDSLPNDDYTWWIQTKNVDGTGPLSSSMTFTVTAFGVVNGGYSHAVAADRDGLPSGWGLNVYGQVGDGSTLDRYTAVAVYGVVDVVDVQAGEFHTVALLNDGTVWAWGYNGNGQLGDGTTTDSATAVQVSGITDATAIAVGRNHTLALLAGGTVKAWGSNSNGQLGDNSTTDRTSPVAVSSLTSVIAIGTGATHSLAVKSDGTGRSWGDNFYGQLGDGTNTERLTPVTVSGLTSATLVAASSSANHSLALRSDGTVRSWGLNADGQLGDNSTTDATSPVTVTSLSSVAALAAGESHSIALKTDNTVHAWGDNTEGQIGDGTTTDRLTSVSVTGLTSIEAIGAGQLFSLAVKNDGTVYTWGANTDGQLADGTTISQDSPLDVSGTSFSFRTATPRIRVAGATYENDLDVVIEFEAPTQGATIYYTTNGNTPTTSDTSIISGASVSVTLPLTLKAKAFATGYTASHLTSETYGFKVATPSVDPVAGTYATPQFVSIATATDGADLRYTTDGSTPTGASTLYTDPIPLLQTTTVKVKGLRTSWTDSDLTTALYTISPKAVGAGTNHSIALTSAGTVFAWGNNSNGELGDGTTTAHDMPAAVSSLTSIASIATGNYFNLALEDDGTVHAWGDNQRGQLGDGSTTDRTTAVSVSGLTNIVAIAAGSLHSVALEDDGTVWTWGYNTDGQLGDGTNTQRTTPVEVTALTDVVAIAAGWEHTLAVKSDGTLWAWGENAYSQLGDGGTTDQNSPVQVQGASGIVAAAAGRYHSLALRGDDGQVFAWGQGASGQIGNGSELLRSVPAPSSISGAVAIGAGSSHSFAVKTDGTQWAWGIAGGQVGDGTEDEVLSPVQLSGPTNVVGIDGGTLHSVSVTSDGSVWAWGSNVYGQVGDGTSVKRLSPVEISDADFDWKTSTPTLDLAPGEYLDVQNVTVTTTDASSTLHYTTNGVEPVDTDATVTSGNTVAVDQSMTFKVKGFDATLAPSNTTEAVYAIQAQTPQASPVAGSYGTAQSVSLSSATSGTSIRYTTDGSEPTAGSSLYSSALNIATSTTLRAKAFKTDWVESETMTLVYTMTFGSLTAPVMSPTPPVSNVGSVEVTLTGPGVAALYYTTDGTEPTTSSTLYSAPFTLTATTTLKAKAFHIDYTPSATTTGVYTIRVPDPTATPSGGTYTAGETVTVSNTLAGVLNHYTLDGTTPTDDDPALASGETVTLLDDFTLKVKSYKTGTEPSNVLSETYTATGAVTPTPIGAGKWHSLAVEPDDTGWGWGYNYWGQLADNSWQDKHEPEAITGLSAVAQVDGGDDHTLALETDDTGLSVGRNTNGQLGDGSTSYRWVPVSTGSLTDLVAVAAGSNHSLAIESDGTLWAWGKNNKGQLGDGTTTQRTSPVEITSVTNIAAIAAGEEFSVAVEDDGTVWTWGYNGYGQLGDDSTTDSSSPVELTSISDVVAIAAGAHHVLAAESDGTLWAWGRNNYLGGGALGDGTTTNRDEPVAVKTEAGAQSSGLTKVLAVGAGFYHSFAVRADGSLWAWGSNTSYQLGDGTLTAKAWAEPQASLSGIVAATGGEKHSLAVTADGELFSWGLNHKGQVGDGTTTTRKTPLSLSADDLDWRVLAPEISPAGGAFNVEKTVTITTETSGATIYYTTDGSEPTDSDTEVTGNITVDESMTLKARAYKTGVADSIVAAETYTLNIATPSFSPIQGNYSTNQNVTISSTSPSVTFRYTTDGTTPDGTSTLYSGPVLIDGTQTLKAIAYRTGWTDSAVNTGIYTMKVGTPTLSPTGGTHTGDVDVTVTSTTTGATLHYTTDSSFPTESSPTIASGSDVTLTQSGTLKVRAFNGTDWTPSDIQLGTYYIDQGTAAAPTAEPAAGTYTEVQTVSLTSATANAVIRYTIDGTEPTTSSTVFTSPIPIDWSLTLKAKAFLPGWTASTTLSAAYTINLTNTVAPPTFSPAGGRYATDQTVTLTSATSGSTIHYTTNGDEPTTSDASVATGSTVTVDASVALKAMAVKATMTDSSVRREDYQITGAVQAAHLHALALNTDGTVVSWGRNDWGQLGNGTTSGSATAPAVIASFTDVVAIGAYGGQYRATSFAVKSDGTLWGWGHGGDGKLGNGTTANKTTPTQVSTLTDVVAVAAGNQHTLALESDGDVFAWGGKYEGALGDGATTGTVTTPQQVSGVSDIVAIAADHRFSLALKDDGTVWAWGRNVEGQLGDGTTTQRTTPVQVPNLSGISAIAAGGYHALALEREGGVVWAWGYNSDGQLGDGSTTNRSTPMRVAEGVQSLSAFDNTSLLLHEDSGYLHAVLGAGEHIGNYIGTSTQPSSETFITLLRGDLVQVSAGTSINLALLADTSIIEWGTMEATGADGDVLGDDTGIDDDPDGDGLSTGEEWSLGTDPYDADTNDDGILDGIAQASGMSATDPDMDDDGVLNGSERTQGTDPFNADTDGDTVNDGTDDFPLDPTRDTAPSSNPSDTTPPTITLDEPTNASLISSVP